MNLLDWLLLVLVLAYALSGYWQGFVTGAFATAGLLLGGLLGVWLAPIALGDADPSLWVSLGALFIVILAASLGQALLQFAGARIRDKITWQPARARRRRRRRRCSARSPCCSSPGRSGVAISGSRIGRVTPMVRELRRARQGRRRAARVGRQRAAGLQQRRRHQLLPALPRAVRARADRRGRARSASGCSPTPTSSAPRPACSRSAAATTAAAASRAPASSTPPTG